MKGIAWGELTKKNAKYCYQGKAYTGYGFVVEQDKVTTAVNLIDGETAGSWNPARNSGPAMSMCAFESSTAPFALNQVPFTGTIYHLTPELVAVYVVEHGVISEFKDYSHHA